MDMRPRGSSHGRGGDIGLVVVACQREIRVILRLPLERCERLPHGQLGLRVAGEIQEALPGAVSRPVRPDEAHAIKCVDVLVEGRAYQDALLLKGIRPRVILKY